MKRAFVYCRVSTDEQSGDNHYSLAVQEERCREYAKQREWQVVTVRKDVGSGRDGDRPGYQELLSDIETDCIDVVVTYRLDRLSRNVRDVYDFLQKTGDASVGFVSTSEAFDTTAAMGRAMLGVAAVFAQLTREMIAENVQDGLAKRAQAGKYVGAKNPGPYGYDYSVEQGSLLVNEGEAKVVRRIFELYARQKWGHAKIARQLNHEGFRGKMGAQWLGSDVRRILQSPLYAGKIQHKAEAYEGEHEPIVGRELFGEAQELMQQRSTLPPRSHQSQHLLAGIVRCGNCGSRLRGHWTSTRGGGESKRYRLYYHRGNTLAGARRCKGVSKSAPRLEEAVLEKVREVASSPEFQETALAEAKKQLASDLPAVRQERDEVAGRLADLAQKFEQWAERLDNGLIDEEQFKSRNAALLKEKEALQERLADLDAKAAEGESIEVGMEQVKQMLGDFDRVWEEMTLDEQREFLRNLVEDLRVWKERAELKLLFLPPMEIPVRFQRGRRAKAESSASQKRSGKSTVGASAAAEDSDSGGQTEPYRRMVTEGENPGAGTPKVQLNSTPDLSHKR